MTRTVKDPEVRKAEIVDASIKLFGETGYEETSVSDIVKKAGVAQGTFYYYFKSKEDILDAIADRVVSALQLKMDQIISIDNMDALDKMTAVTSYFNNIGKEWGKLMDYLHEDRNVHLHQKVEKRVYPVLIPQYQKIIEQGCSEGLFDVDFPQETAISVLTVSNALTHGQHSANGKLDLSQERIMAIIDIEERLLGAPKGSFGEYLQRKGVVF